MAPKAAEGQRVRAAKSAGKSDTTSQQAIDAEIARLAALTTEEYQPARHETFLHAKPLRWRLGFIDAKVDAARPKPEPEPELDPKPRTDKASKADTAKDKDAPAGDHTQ